MQTGPLFNQIPPIVLRFQALKHKSTDVRNIKPVWISSKDE